MIRQCVILFVVLFVPTASLPQRYGRPYTLAEPSEFYLQIKVQKKSHYFCRSDLRKMQRSVVTVADPTTNTQHAYEGVDLERLMPVTAPPLKNEIIQIEFGSHQTLTIAGVDPAPETKLIVVDAVDGKHLSGNVPYYFLEERRDKNLQKLTEVRSININFSR